MAETIVKTLYYAGTSSLIIVDVFFWRRESLNRVVNSCYLQTNFRFIIPPGDIATWTSGETMAKLEATNSTTTSLQQSTERKIYFPYLIS
jgi:hypothetical protein